MMALGFILYVSFDAGNAYTAVEKADSMVDFAETVAWMQSKNHRGYITDLNGEVIPDGVRQVAEHNDRRA